MVLAEKDFSYISRFVQQRSAIVLGPGKEYLVESRLLPLVRSVADGDISQLVSKLQSGADERLAAAVVEAMTTNETLFFRDVHPFEALRSHVLPELFAARRGTGRLSFWCGASSSGQEPYSVAMVLQEELAGRPGWTAEVLATDISEAMLQRTREATYSQLEVNRGLPIAALMKHFDRDGTHWQVKEPLRRMVTTQAVNLAAPLPPLGTFDVVFLRNVLIYFSPETKRAALEQVRALLRPDGYLFLGGAETTLTVDPAAWEPVTLGPSTAYRPRRAA